MKILTRIILKLKRILVNHQAAKDWETGIMVCLKRILNNRKMNQLLEMMVESKVNVVDYFWILFYTCYTRSSFDMSSFLCTFSQLINTCGKEPTSPSFSSSVVPPSGVYLKYTKSPHGTLQERVDGKQFFSAFPKQISTQVNGLYVTFLNKAINSVTNRHLFMFYKMINYCLNVRKDHCLIIRLIF